MLSLDDISYRLRPCRLAAVDRDHLGASMLLRRFNTHQRGQRIGQLLRELDEGMGLAAPALGLTPGECADVITKLGGEIYNQWIVRKYVLIRRGCSLRGSDSSGHTAWRTWCC